MVYTDVGISFDFVHDKKRDIEEISLKLAYLYAQIRLLYTPLVTMMMHIIKKDKIIKIIVSDAYNKDCLTLNVIKEFLESWREKVTNKKYVMTFHFLNTILVK
jgi:hypothetical protein